MNELENCISLVKRPHEVLEIQNRRVDTVASDNSIFEKICTNILLVYVLVVFLSLTIAYFTHHFFHDNFVNAVGQVVFATVFAVKSFDSDSN